MQKNTVFFLGQLSIIGALILLGFATYRSHGIDDDEERGSGRNSVMQEIAKGKQSPPVCPAPKPSPDTAFVGGK